ncbi:MAG: pentapeptide repeat-containing protein [Deltaproteobacteria bacterium]|nr:pentapeptide repeat-containing protein [Deltaproteobacteria bacterium]
MTEDDIENDNMDDDEESDDLQEFSIKELGQAGSTNQTGLDREIFIEERKIPNLAEIVAIANKADRPISIEDCVLDKTRIDAANIDIFIDESVFAGEAESKNAVFGGKLVLTDTIFEENADFGAATFQAEVSFDECVFQNEVSFAGARVEHGASFTSCNFQKEITFDHASFAGKVSFSESTFRKKVTCTDALFWKEVDLRDVKFKEGLDTTGSNLEDMIEVARQAPRSQQKKPREKAKPRKTEFNPWGELDKVSKKNLSCRQILRGVFRFLPEKKNE